MNPGSTSPRSRWRHSKFSAARTRLTCVGDRDASSSTDYQLRIISRDAIGHDVNVPPLTISYRVHSRVGAAAKLEGRDLSYVLPAMPIRVLSLVPADATDIRDASEASLATVDAWRSRSRRFELLALALAATAAVMLVLAVVPLARRARATTSAGPELIPDRAVLTRAADALSDIQMRATRDGWTDDIVSEALAAIRLVAAATIGRSVSQRPLGKDGVVPDGRLLVRFGRLRSVSSNRFEPGHRRRGRPIGDSRRHVHDGDARSSPRGPAVGARGFHRRLVSPVAVA